MGEREREWECGCGCEWEQKRRHSHLICKGIVPAAVGTLTDCLSLSAYELEHVLAFGMPCLSFAPFSASHYFRFLSPFDSPRLQVQMQQQQLRQFKSSHTLATYLSHFAELPFSPLLRSPPVPLLVCLPACYLILSSCCLSWPLLYALVCFTFGSCQQLLLTACTCLPPLRLRLLLSQPGEGVT